MIASAINGTLVFLFQYMQILGNFKLLILIDAPKKPFHFFLSDIKLSQAKNSEASEILCQLFLFRLFDFDPMLKFGISGVENSGKNSVIFEVSEVFKLQIWPIKLPFISQECIVLLLLQNIIRKTFHQIFFVCFRCNISIFYFMISFSIGWILNFFSPLKFAQL